MNFSLKTKRLFFLILVAFPLINLCINGFFLFDDKKTYIKEIVAFSLLIITLFSILFFFNNKVYRTIVFYFTAIATNIIVFLKLSFLNFYGGRINASAIYIISETNSKEAIGFIEGYLDKWNIFYLLLAIAPVIILVIKSSHSLIFQYFRKNFYKPLFLIVFFIYYHETNKRFYNEDLLFKSVADFKTFKYYKNGLKNKLSSRKSKFLNEVCFDDTDAVHVVVIGESTTRHHMQLYGYDRETNPKLTKIKKDLLVFKNAISPHTHTIQSLEKILTLNSFKNPDVKENFSVVQLANNANYETFWLSMQEPLGITETLPTLISNAADHRYFLETNAWFENIYDEKILAKFKEIIKLPLKRAVIFLHLMGTHATYYKRYPNKFEYFKGKPFTKFNNSRAFKTINEYDNAIRYNDSIVFNIIQQVKMRFGNSSITYFSDHGEEVYEYYNRSGHDEYRSTPAMYEVPFLMWFSDSLKYRKAKSQLIDRKYILEDFPFTFSDLIGVDFPENRTSRSILNERFVEKARTISKNRNYDKIELP